ncbi:hypothetical protein OXPF_03990 [Oxobacter pfennigii]|uniref:Uncharacterized protein n=1 Tax=Oxobacter pfennigii TaxID=36849 RepID=A0A0P8YFS9_9CLOT|nr:hypothetical protein [Oxobacter pfennigii]KPU45931.1 hypothetical protein OXPF_03990 [Oxobacter pfennigii]
MDFSSRENIDENKHYDKDSIEQSNDYDYPIVEHLSNARLMPQTGPMGNLDFLDTFEYSSVPEGPETPLEDYSLIMDKNKKK